MEKNFLLVLFYSASGSVKNLAHAIADGVEDININIQLAILVLNKQQHSYSSKIKQTKYIMLDI